MDHWKSHIPKNNPLKQFCEWSFEQGDQKWQQDELEHEFELWENFFLEEDEVCGCWNKWRGSTWGPQGRGRAQGVGAHVPPLWPGACSPAVFFQCQIFSNIPEKIIFRAFGELLFLGYFLLQG